MRFQGAVRAPFTAMPSQILNGAMAKQKAPDARLAKAEE